MSVNDLYRKIYKELEANKDTKQIEADKKYHRYEGHKTFGIKSSDLRKIFGDFRKEIKELECDKVFEVAERLYKNEIEETILAGNFLLQARPDCLGKSTLSFLDQVLEHFCSWSTVDNFCISVFQPILVKHPRETEKYLKKWNGSENMWKRRASVVAFVRKAGESGRFTDEALSLCSNLINDKQDLVQKGVGWCLKDVMRGDKEKVLKYVKELRQKGISSTITLYAVRDLKGKERKSMLDIK